VIVHTARISCRDPDRLDITRKGGSVFGPSWPLLKAAKRKQIAWEEYTARYQSEMRASYRLAFGEAHKQPAFAAEAAKHRAAWNSLLARERVVLCCYCAVPTQCHRSLLVEILAKVGKRHGFDVQHAGELAS